jgi:H+-translocating NAD(P) transhydrogenase subunit alpha
MSETTNATAPATNGNNAELIERLQKLAEEASSLAQEATVYVSDTANIHADSIFIGGLTVFILACFVGYYVVWRVTPALHSPLMGITNAISSVIIVGAVIAAGAVEMSGAKIMGFLAVTLASINIFGGFIVTHRMLQMFKKKS